MSDTLLLVSSGGLLRIVELSTFRENCGVATYTEALVDALSAEGVRVDVLAPKLPGGRSAGGRDPARLWSRGRATTREALATFSEIRRRRPHLVHAQVNLGLFSPRFLLTLGALCRARRIPLVATLHGRGGGSPGRRFELERVLFALRRSALIVHNAEHARELGSARVRVIPHGVRPPAAVDIAQAKQALGLDPAQPVIAHFGFLHADKGIEEMLAALAVLAKSELPRIHYVVCGGCFSDRGLKSYADVLRERAAALGIADRVSIRGQFADDDSVLGDLCAADWIVLNYQTGRRQGTSGAARHALRAGRPLAVSCAPVFDDLRDAVHTMTEPLVREIPRLLSDSELRRNVLERCRRYSQAYSWARVASLHRELFESAVQQTSGVSP